MWLLKQSVDAYVCACMCRHTCVLRTFLLHVKVYFASVVHPRFSPCSSPSDARVCVPSLCLLAFRNTPACMFHTIPNLTYVAVCLPSCAVPFPRGRLASLPAQEDAAEPRPARKRAGARRLIVRLSLGLGRVRLRLPKPGRPRTHRK